MSTNQTAQIVISAVIVSSFVGIVVGWLVSPPHVDNSQTLALLTGSLATAFGQVINYWLKPTQ